GRGGRAFAHRDPLYSVPGRGADEHVARVGVDRDRIGLADRGVAGDLDRNTRAQGVAEDLVGCGEGDPHRAGTLVDGDGVGRRAYRVALTQHERVGGE